MPALFFYKGIRFYFYSNENNEPPLIHVSKGDNNGKIWLYPEVEIAYLYDFSKRDLRDIMNVIKDRYQIFKEQWDEYFEQ